MEPIVLVPPVLVMQASAQTIYGRQQSCRVWGIAQSARKSYFAIIHLASFLSRSTAIVALQPDVRLLDGRSYLYIMIFFFKIVLVPDLYSEVKVSLMRGGCNGTNKRFQLQSFDTRRRKMIKPIHRCSEQTLVYSYGRCGRPIGSGATPYVCGREDIIRPPP